ncbi:MAG: UDP-glucose dehydrogenase family protein [Aestuariivirga sp.]
MRVCMIGSGYVGLVTGTCFAEIGHDVVCVDKDEAKIARLLAGDVPIYEPGLKELIATNRRDGRLSFSASIHEAVSSRPNFYFIAVGTPARAEDGGADLSYVYEAADETAKTIASQHGNNDSFSVFVTKSTVPVGTSREVARIAGRHLGEERVAVASNPEFLREGCAIEDFMAPDRIIAGSRSERARGMLEELYRPLTRQGRPLVVTTTVETAELIKYAANAFLATKISFINELSRLCEKIGADVDELALGIGLDKRIGDKFLKAGPGYGGSCFPKDTLALIKTANDFHSPVEIVETVVRVNNRHKHFMYNKIRDALGGSVTGKKIAVLGLAFKAMTDDVRDSPALTIVPVMRREGAEITAYDPVAADNAKDQIGNGTVRYATTLEEALKGADAAVLLTEWDEFRKADWRSLSKSMAKPLLIDLRNVFSLSQANSIGIDYVSLGRDRVVSRH